jgi:hypothetical protein
VFGGAPGASDASVALADDLSRTANVLISASWLIFLFFVPALLDWMRGARNAFAVMMFAWAGAGAGLVGTFALSTRPVSDPRVQAGMRACSAMFGLLVGIFGGLGYTATEVYLDTCAEWMPLSLEAAGEGGKKKAKKGAAAPAPAADGGEAPPPAPTPAQESAAREIKRKAVASKYKNLFASHIYAFVEVGTVAFTLPGALGAVDGGKMLYLLIAITACLLAGAVAALFVPNLHPPHAAAAKDADADAPRRGACAALLAVVKDAGRSAVQSITCLSAYNWLAALAIVPYFLSAAYADNYFQFVVVGTQCGLREKPAGIGLSGVNLMALFGSAVQAVSAFLGPTLVGPRRFQFKEHMIPLAVGNLCGTAGALMVVAHGGLTDALCGSLGTMLTAKALASIAYGVNNSVGVAAVLCWYEGPYQALVVSALASRSVWTQLGGIVGPYTFSDAFSTMNGGAPAAGLAAAIYTIGAVCVVAAPLIVDAIERRRVAARAEALVESAASAAELNLVLQEGRMTAGFSAVTKTGDAPDGVARRRSSAVRGGSGGGGGWRIASNGVGWRRKSAVDEKAAPSA